MSGAEPLAGNGRSGGSPVQGAAAPATACSSAGSLLPDDGPRARAGAPTPPGPEHSPSPPLPAMTCLRPRGPPLVPPLQFACVGQGLYRGGYPKPVSAPFLDGLRLTTVVSITPEPVDLSFLGSELKAVHVPGGSAETKSKKKRGVPLSDALVCRVLQLLENPENWPVYVHCLNGQQVTSLVIACLRVKQRWSIRSAFDEYSRFIDYDRKEVAFVEWFEQQHCR